VSMRQAECGAHGDQHPRSDRTAIAEGGSAGGGGGGGGGERWGGDSEDCGCGAVDSAAALRWSQSQLTDARSTGHVRPACVCVMLRFVERHTSELEWTACEAVQMCGESCVVVGCGVAG